ncbi:MAG: leucine-rich repeat domain-containing protein, partial [Clostridia bacterium]|nr:leucine-rich repeat domain-containing protein [Clostridia bacterium]
QYHWQESTCGHDVINAKATHVFDDRFKCEVCNYYSDNGFKFELNPDNETYSVVGLEDGNDNTIIVIPSTYKGKPVTDIAAKAFEDRGDLVSVEIPSGIKSIGSYAFDGCKGLKGVYITDMSSWCNIYFKGSRSNPLEYAEKLYLNNQLVTQLVIPADITDIDRYAFANCADITGLTVDPNNAVYKSQGNCIIEKQSNKLVLGCKNSEIPNFVTSVGDSAFAGCKGLTSIDIPSNVTSIGYRAFDNCSDLTSVKIPSGITSIDEGAFKHCSSLTSVKIPSGIESVGRETFYGCKSLTSVEIPSGITKISSAAFALCGNLMEITIPSSVTEIESLAFVGCRALTIYCETATQPIGWVSGWKGNNPVVWNSESNEIAEDGYIYFVAENGIRYALKDGIAKITDQSELIGGNKEIPTSISYKDIEYSVTSI